MFVVKQIVWAKVKNYPWWPAEINKLPTSQHNYFKVTFVGQTNHAHLQQKAVRKYLDHYQNLKSNTYKGLQNSIEIANNLIQKRKAIIEDQQNKLKNIKNCDKVKKIKKNSKTNKRKTKGREKIIKNSNYSEINFENDCSQKQKPNLKNEGQISNEKPFQHEEKQHKSEVKSVDLSQNCDGQSAEVNQIQFMRSVDRKKIEHTEQVLFSFIKRFNSNIFENQNDCVEAIKRVDEDELTPQQIIQSKITNMITYLNEKLSQRKSPTLKSEDLENINKIRQKLIQRALSYLFDCSYYDQYIKKMENHVTLSHIGKQQSKKIQSRIPKKKNRKYKRRNQPRITNTP